MKLLKIYDLRITDTDGSKALCCEPHKCNRCNRDHARVYVIEDDNGKVYELGSTCCKRMFGWEPTAKEIRTAELTPRAEKMAAKITRRFQDFVAANAWTTAKLNWSNATYDERVTLNRLVAKMITEA